MAPSRIQYKISTICLNSNTCTFAVHLSELLEPYTPIRQLRSASDTGTFVTTRVNTRTFDGRSFSYVGPCLEQFASNTPPLWFVFLFQNRSQYSSVQQLCRMCLFRSRVYSHPISHTPSSSLNLILKLSYWLYMCVRARASLIWLRFGSLLCNGLCAPVWRNSI